MVYDQKFLKYEALTGLDTLMEQSENCNTTISWSEKKSQNN